MKPTLGKWEEQEAETTLLQNTTLKFGLESTVTFKTMKLVLITCEYNTLFRNSRNILSNSLHTLTSLIFT